MAPRPYDEEELSMSLSSQQLWRQQQKGATAHPPRAYHDGTPATRVDNRYLTDERMPGSTHNAAGHGHSSGQHRSRTRTGERIDQYNIIRTLGEGSFGKVKLAVHKSTKQQVALKIIARKKLISRDMAGRVEREIEYLQLLRHPHIIKLFTVLKTTNEIVMVLEYAGGELFDYIVQHGRMRDAEARRFFQQMLCAVEYCHRHKIVHRDLKPENLLLDENLNVKIADFGLSNIMTDGNFLKTSCGSPNYAAPEVIGGKLYAGPEVDVWSCGVILYVLLVGRLPFDDDHIPSLFAKIAKGTYAVPTWMSPGAAALIKKMLVVNPVHRATVAEIRADPWFMQDLPEYLQPPVAEFLTTGVDLDKAIKVSDIAPNAPLKEQEKLHNEVTDKISKTMGYGKSDVLEALEAEEPSAIKDAYLIVRENKMMESNPLLSDNNPYFPPSPPSTTKEFIPSETLSLAADSGASPLGGSSRSMTSTSTGTSPRLYVSKVGVLPSSLPAYHKAYMEHRAGINDSPTMPAAPEPLGQPRSQADQEETLRRLRPHSRSQLRLDEASKRPQSLTPLTVKKVKPTRWQFGIRSRSSPWEALQVIYRSLARFGCTWKTDEDYDKVHGPEEGQEETHGEHRSRKRDASARPDPSEVYRLPADPWHIHVRWLTEKLKKIRSFPSSNPPEKTEVTTHKNEKYEVVAMRLDIQIYENEGGSFLVDFKCDGYETADGHILEEKEVSSPFPFLDLAARLIMALAD